MDATSGSQSGWDMHDQGAEVSRARRSRRRQGSLVTGEVVCHHVFGIGVRLSDGDYGHVNVPEISSGMLRGLEDFPPIGAEVKGIVLGYSGVDQQLRLSLKMAV